jgi:hypothetical protein
MRTIIANVLFVAAVGLPLYLLHVLRRYFAWVDKCHDYLSIIAWIVTVALLYAVVAPHFGFERNPEFDRYTP